MALSLTNCSGRILRSIQQLLSPTSFSPSKFWESRHQSLAGRLAAVGHAQLTESENLKQYEIKSAHLRDALLRHIPKPVGQSLLDAGCGIGALTKVYVELGFEVAGVDFSASAIAAARNAGINAEFQQASLDRLSLGRSFDVVCLVDVLQHVVDDEMFARSVAAVARHVNRDGLALVVDTMTESAASATHCRRRSLPWHEAEFRIAGLEMIGHDQFTLPHEASTKDLVAFKRRFQIA